MKNENQFGNVVFSYTREEAINDGVLVDVSGEAKEAGLRWPTAVTAAVWEKYVEWNEEDTKRQTYQDIKGRLWDIVWMLRVAIQCSKNPDHDIFYKLYIVPRDGKAKKPELTTLKCNLGGGDDGEPVLTIMLPNED